MKYKPHPFAELFPLMSAAEQEALTADIKANGLRQPIVLYQKQILDGRNRAASCKEAGVDHVYVDFEGDDVAALAFVLSLNAARRNLAAGQRAIVAAKIWRAHGDTTKRGPKKKGENGELTQSASITKLQLAKQFHVSDNTIAQARDLLAEAPDLAQLVESDDLTLAAAGKQLEDRRLEVKQRARDLEHIRRYAEYAQAVKDGEMTVEAALQKVIEQEREEKKNRDAEADARGRWLTGLAEMVDWVRRFISQYDDEHLAWYVIPNSPGMDKQGLTAEKIAETISQLERVRVITFAGDTGARSKRRSRPA
jgi:hypothetical protein